MRILWTMPAANDLESIANYLYEQNPTSAAQILRRIYHAPAILRQFPNSGRLGRKEGTRELVLTSLPISSSIRFLEKMYDFSECYMARSAGHELNFQS